MLTSDLASLLIKMPDLNILLLHMMSQGPDLALFEAMHTLKNLKTLRINMPAKNTAVPIETMFPLLANLDELRLEGSWYQHEADMHGFLQGEPWRMKRLAIQLRDISLVRHCPYLEHLRFLPSTRPMARITRVIKDIVAELLTKPTSLKTIMLYLPQSKKHRSFQIYSEGGKPGHPHRSLNANVANTKKWFSTADIVGHLK
jgi:hypothetical protein